MTYVVTDACIKCKYTDCVEVCRSTASTRARRCWSSTPAECIDCGVCEPECPAEAILPDTEGGLEQWLELNTKYSAEWPNITEKKDPPPTPTTSRASKASTTSTSRRNPAKATEPAPIPGLQRAAARELTGVGNFVANLLYT
jgi:ferredoxin